MQLFALDDEKVIQAAEAVKRRDYICLECQEPLRVRSGEIRQSHFYHVRPNQKCSQHQKSLKHLQVQWRLQQLLGQEECSLERPFPSIKRIADAVWLSRKIIFEVQCSPITAEEVLQRNRDYGSQGFSVVWILHDSRYNQWRLSAAENALRLSPHYFTDIDRQGEGIIYDQYAYIHQGRRRETGAVWPVDIRQVLRSVSREEPLPILLQERLSHWSLFFQGDLATQPCQAALHIEKKWDALLYPKKKRGLWRGAKKMYLAIFRYLLEAVCD